MRFDGRKVKGTEKRERKGDGKEGKIFGRCVMNFRRKLFVSLFSEEGKFPFKQVQTLHGIRFVQLS